MSFSNATENSILLLLYNATTWANVAENASSSPITDIFVSGHTADPGEAGTQSTNECAYGSYARVAVARSGAGWTVTNNSVSPAAAIDFPAATSGTETMTHAATGKSTSGANPIYHKGAVTPNVAISTGVTARLTTASTLTLD